MSGADSAPAPTGFATIVAQPVGASPLRRPGSIRRTSSIDTDWPEGRSGAMRIRGHARDIVSLQGGNAAVVTAEAQIDVLLSPLREIIQIDACPANPAIHLLVGKRAGGHLRAAINDVLPEERATGSPLYLLVDDLAGASLVAGWAWSRWDADWLDRLKQAGSTSTAGRNGRMDGVCIGFAPGSSALRPDGSSSTQQSCAIVPQLENAADPLGWHELPSQTGVGMRRARRIDVWPDGDLIRVESGFQDSATSPGGERVAVHEYTLEAAIDRTTGRLQEVTAQPRVLPYAECPTAAANVHRLVGEDVSALRFAVLRTLAGTSGCTHLNDCLRALAEVPQLCQELQRHQ